VDFVSYAPITIFPCLGKERGKATVARSIETDSADMLLRLALEGAGIVRDSTLVARKIVDLTRIICASPEYIARHGRPAQPSDPLG
jgi:DNA-binding transcriptional LysR family regulator